jgi:hypothetical protein
MPGIYESNKLGDSVSGASGPSEALTPKQTRPPLFENNFALGVNRLLLPSGRVIFDPLLLCFLAVTGIWLQKLGYLFSVGALPE